MASLARQQSSTSTVNRRSTSNGTAPGRDNMTAEAPPPGSSLLRLHRRVARQFTFVGLLIDPSCRGAPVLCLNGGQGELQLLGPRNRLAQRLTRRELAAVQLHRSLPQLRPTARGMQGPALQRGTRVGICQRPVGLTRGGRIMVIERRRRIGRGACDLAEIATSLVRALLRKPYQ